MAMIEQNGKKNLTLIHVLLTFETLNCVHSYSKLKLTAGKASVWCLKTLFLLKAKSVESNKMLGSICRVFVCGNSEVALFELLYS